MSSFQDRVAVVTGAGSGIGKALALGLAQRGARLALSDVDEAGLEQTRMSAELFGAEVHTARVDVADRAAVEAHATDVVASLGGVHQLYNNAGIAFSRTILESTYEDYERVLGVNLWGVIHGTKAFLPHLIASGAGHVVNISSLNGFMAQAEMSHYVSSKFAVRGFTETLRVEMLTGRHPVKVTVVHPGGIKTNIATSALEAARAAGEDITAEVEARSKLYNDKLLTMVPDEAAKIILDGVGKNRPRVLVGNDAKGVDVLVRALPGLYPRAVVAYSKKLLAGGR